MAKPVAAPPERRAGDVQQRIAQQRGGQVRGSAAAEELERCVTQHGFVGMVTATHVREKNLDHPSFDPVWETAERLGVAVCTHGGGQAPGQTPFAIDRFTTGALVAEHGAAAVAH